MLTMIYLGGAVGEGHGDEHGHEPEPLGAGAQPAVQL